jgi:phage major head subunit gpT-like protein
MSAPHTSENFGDLLDPRFQKIFHDQYDELPDMISELYSIENHNGRQNMTFSQVGTVPDFEEFTGQVNYNAQNEGYDTTITYKEFTNGIQVERKLFDDDQYSIMDSRPRGLATAAQRTRQRHAAQLLNNAFSVDNTFSDNSEGVALCSDSHTTTSGASTASGFDNKGTSALSATAVAAARIQMVGYRGDQAERISIMPDEIWIPNALYEEAFEIVSSMGKLDTNNNNRNVHEGQYTIKEWNYLTDDNNWFMCDSSMRKMSTHWIDRVPLEFAMAEDFDTFIAKWRAYMRYAAGYSDWRWIFGAQVA